MKLAMVNKSIVVVKHYIISNRNVLEDIDGHTLPTFALCTVEVSACFAGSERTGKTPLVTRLWNTSL